MEYCGTSRYAPNHKTPSLTCYSRAELDGEHNSNGSKFLFLAIEGDDDDYYYCYRGPLNPLPTHDGSSTYKNRQMFILWSNDKM